MKSVSIWLLLLLSLTVKAQTPPFATITSVDYRGTGCDAESARVVITPDLQYLSVLYDRFSAEVGASTPQRIANKNCVITVNFDLPAGWSFQFEGIEYRGFVSLPNQRTQASQMIAVNSVRTGKGRDFQQNLMRGPKMENFTYLYRNQIDATPEQGVVPNNVRPVGLLGGRINEVLDRIAEQRGHGNGNGPGNGHGGGGPGFGPGNGGPGSLLGKIRRIRRGDMFDCSERVQNQSLTIRSRISVTNAGDPARSAAQIVVDSADATFTQKLKINWNQCLRDN